MIRILYLLPYFY